MVEFEIAYNLILEYEECGNFFGITLKPGQSFRVFPLVKHRFSTDSKQCKFIEASTTHMESDSYRCSWIPETEKWEESGAGTNKN